jgi:hypothetical protein
MLVLNTFLKKYLPIPEKSSLNKTAASNEAAVLINYKRDIKDLLL